MSARDVELCGGVEEKFMQHIVSKLNSNNRNCKKKPNR